MLRRFIITISSVSFFFFLLLFLFPCVSSAHSSKFRGSGLNRSSSFFFFFWLLYTEEEVFYYFFFFAFCFYSFLSFFFLLLFFILAKTQTMLYVDSRRENTDNNNDNNNSWRERRESVCWANFAFTFNTAHCVVGEEGEAVGENGTLISLCPSRTVARWTKQQFRWRVCSAQFGFSCVCKKKKKTKSAILLPSFLLVCLSVYWIPRLYVLCTSSALLSLFVCLFIFHYGWPKTLFCLILLWCSFQLSRVPVSPPVSCVLFCFVFSL